MRLRPKFLLYFAGKPHFDAFCDHKMGATVAPISKKVGGHSKKMRGALATWPPLISIAGMCAYHRCGPHAVACVNHVATIIGGTNREVGDI